MFPVGLNKFWQRISNSLYQTDANTIAQRNSTTAQSMRVHGTYTDANNYQALFLKATSASAYLIAPDNIVGGTPGGSTTTLKICMQRQNGNGGLITTDGSNNGVQIGDATGIGLWVNSSANMRLSSNSVLAWSNTNNNAVAASTTGFSQLSAGVMALGTGTANSYAGSLKLTNLIATGSISAGLSSKTADYTLTANDGTITADSTSSAITLTLETAVGHTRIHAFKKTAGVNLVTIDGNASETIDGAPSITLTDRCILQSNGTEWKQIA